MKSEVGRGNEEVKRRRQKGKDEMEKKWKDGSGKAPTKRGRIQEVRSGFTFPSRQAHYSEVMAIH